jgi:hypothetical protein
MKTGIAAHWITRGTTVAVAAAAAVAALASCEQGNGGAPTDGPVEDDAAIPADLLPAPGGDLAPMADSAEIPVDASHRPDLPLLESCYAIHGCVIIECKPGTIKVCAPECMARGSADAMKWFAPLLQCAAPKCFNNGDCDDPADPSCNLCFTINCFQELMDCFNN